MADPELPHSIPQAVLLSQKPELRATMTAQRYRNLLETAILDAPAWAETVQFPFTASELIPVRVYLALTLAAELVGRPLHGTDLAEAVHWYDQAEGLRATAPRTWAVAKLGAGQAWLGRSDVPRSQAVTRAVAVIEQSLEVVTPDADADEWALTVVALGEAQRQIEPDGPSLSVTTLDTALTAAPPGLSSRSRLRLETCLASSLFRHGERAGDAGDLERAVALFTGVLPRLEESEVAERATVLTNLGAALGLRAERGWSPDWSRAVQVLTDAVALRDRDKDPGPWASTAGNLGIVLKNRPDGDRLVNLAKARKIFEDCAESLARLGRWWSWAAGQNNLGNLLMVTPGGDTEELTEAAVAAYENARRVWTRDQHPYEWALTTARLARAVERRGGSPARTESYRLYAEALDALDRQRYPVAWARISIRLASAEQSMVSDAAPQVAAALSGQLRTAIGRFQEAADIFLQAGNRFDAASANHNRGLALVDLARIARDPSAIGAALAALRTARELRSVQEVPWDWATTTLVLADLQAGLGENLPARDYYREALAVLRTEGESRWILRAAAGLGRVSGQLSDWGEANGAFQQAMEALDALYAAALLRSAQERALADAGSIVAEAAYAAAMSGDLPGAVAVLEHGRGRLLADAMQRRHDPYLALAASHPSEYQAYRSAVADLEVAESAALRLRDRDDLDAAGDRYRLAAEQDTRMALRLARQRFKAADAVLATAERDREPGTSVTVVYLVAASAGAVALTSAPDGIRPVWAPDLRAADVQAIVVGDGTDPGLLAAQQDGGSGLDDALERALPVVARLVTPLAVDLAAHGTTDVCLVACGSLALFPLHATPCGDQLFGDMMTVSYAPSAAMLVRCEQESAERRHDPDNVLVVSDPLGDLRFGRCETSYLLARLPGTTLEGPAATRDEVRRALRTSTLVHFACHGRSVPDQPLQSHLVLADGELSLLDLSVGDEESTAMPAAALVVASACQTALVEGSSLPDEYLGLSSGFLMAGVPCYIGTLWPADDVPAALTSIRLYELLYPADDAEPLTPARALQEAQRWLRSLTGRELVAFADRNPAFRAVAAQQVELAAQMADERLYDQVSAWAPQIVIGAGATGPGRVG